MNSKIILFILFACFTATCIAQTNEDKGYVRLKIDGLYKPLCRLDTTKLNTNDTLLILSAGKHRVRIWEPTLKLIDSTITVKANDTAKYSFTVENSREFARFKYNYSNYRTKRNQRLFVSPILIAVTICGGLYVEKNQAEQQYKKAMQAKDIYSRAGNQAAMDLEKENFARYKKKYDNYKKVEYGIYAFAGVLAINSVRIIIKQRKVPIPQFKQEKLLSRMDFNISPELQNKVMIYGLTMKF